MDRPSQPPAGQASKGVNSQDRHLQAMRIPRRATLQQLVARSHRLHESEREVAVYDYVDAAEPVPSKMDLNRIRHGNRIRRTMRWEDTTCPELACSGSNVTRLRRLSSMTAAKMTALVTIG